MLRLLATSHAALYRGSGGRLGTRKGAIRFLLLHTTGARTGKARTLPLLCLADPVSGALVVVASNGGRDSHPGWLHNLRAQPQARVTLGRESWAVRAREAGEEERSRLWPLLDALYPYGSYRAHTARPIPLVLLERQV